MLPVILFKICFVLDKLHMILSFCNFYIILKIEIGDKQNAGVIVDFVSNVNVKLFTQILKESDSMTEAMKELIAPELINLRLTIANKEKEIANKNAEIAKLKQQLQEMAQQRE